MFTIPETDTREEIICKVNSIAAAHASVRDCYYCQ